MALAVMQESYIEDFSKWANLPSGLEATNIRAPYYPSNGLEWVRGLPGSTDSEVFAILKRVQATGDDFFYQYVGHTGIHAINWHNRFGTTGTAIGDEQGRGKGVGTESKLWLQHHAFNIMGLRKLISRVKAFNAPSIGHLIKCGYAICGRHRDHDFHNGSYVDEVVLEVHRENWLPIFKKYQESGELPKLTQEQRELIERETKK
ncbi:MAG: GCN5-related N-acetyltransferase [Parcubacteria bacterium C7867-001]|nr:MAG: GCN5-related N-acetyltransferase [Parcubacteria bacterium C7867-001]